jgi:hypothetical protein
MTLPLPWTDAEIEQLTELWNSRKTASQIAALMGKSRNAVIGKVHRLKLDGRPSPIKRFLLPMRDWIPAYAETPKRVGECAEPDCREPVERKSYCAHHAGIYYVNKEEVR